ncbi:MAG: methionine aminotransferase [Saprospiraceae bacterium]
MLITSKLPNVGTTIFSVMSALANRHGAINLSQGFPNFDCSDKLKKIVGKYIEEGYNQYAPMPGVPALRQRLTEKIKKLYNTDVDPDSEITITAGATQALYCAISAFVKPDDEVILIEPAYDSYRPAVEINGGIPVTYQMEAPDYQVNWKMLERLITWKTRMIVVNTPHNPTGKIFKTEDWENLKQISVDRDILVLCDEAYEHIVFDGEQHRSILQFPEIYSRGFSVFSLGKTLHATGWKIGACVAPPRLSKEFRKVHQFCTFSINTPIQYAIADFFADPEEYLHLNKFFEKKRDFLLSAMEGSRFKPIKSEGTYFQLFDYSDITDEPDVDFAKRMTTEYGVAAIPVSVFNSNKRDDKIIRLCFAKTEETLAKAGELLKKI